MARWLEESRSLSTKFYILIVGAIFCCGILMGAIFLYATSRSIEERLDQSGEMIASYLGATIADDILTDDYFAILERLTDAMQHNEEVRYILVSNPEHRLLVHTFPTALPEGLPGFCPQREAGTTVYSSNEGRIREILYPVDDGMIGYIRIGMTEKKMVQEMQARFWQIALTVFAVCAVAAYFATRYARFFLEPVAKLSEAVGELGRGNYDVAVPVASHDEMGALVGAFNRMAHSLYEKNAENSSLMQALQKKEELREHLIEQLFSAREDERRRISRELHDESGQSMASILAYLRILHGKLMTDEQRELLLDIRELTASTMGQLRGLAMDLHPPMLEDFGLAAAMEKYLESFRAAQPDLSVHFHYEGEFSDLERTRAVAAYRILQEALTNIVRHAEATTVSVELHCTEEGLALSVTDDGVGFDEETEKDARLNRHLGLVSMRERMEPLNGTLEIQSKVGEGTCVAIKLPCSAGWRNEEGLL